MPTIRTAEALIATANTPLDDAPNCRSPPRYIGRGLALAPGPSGDLGLPRRDDDGNREFDGRQNAE